jgi:hypothetical protein
VLQVNAFLSSDIRPKSVFGVCYFANGVSNFDDFLNPALALLGQGLKKSPIGQKLDFANHPYLCKGLKKQNNFSSGLNWFSTLTSPLSIKPFKQ